MFGNEKKSPVVLQHILFIPHAIPRSGPDEIMEIVFREQILGSHDRVSTF
jgi:hypothetical protein